MSPATVWTELTAPAGGFQEGIPDISYNPVDDFFIDVLYEGTAFFNLTTDWTEMSVGAASYTELSVPATTWTEMSG